MKKTQSVYSLVILLLFSSIMTACGSGQLFGPTITPSPTLTPTTTNTPTPTLTQTPSRTATPTNTQTPTVEPPSQLLNYINGVNVVLLDKFDTLSSIEWESLSCATVNNGILEYKCKNGYFIQRTPMQDGEGIMVDFVTARQRNGYQWGMYYYVGSFGKEDFRTFGFGQSNGIGQVSIMQGVNWSGYNTSWTKAEVWYRLALAIDENGTIAIIVWERDNPEGKTHTAIKKMGEKWAGLTWTFQLGNNDKEVDLQLDNFQIFTFSNFR